MKRTLLFSVAVIAISLAATSAEAAFFVTVTLPSNANFAGATLTAYDGNSPGPNSVISDGDSATPGSIKFNYSDGANFNVGGEFKLEAAGDFVKLFVKNFSALNFSGASMIDVTIDVQASELSIAADPTTLVSNLTVSGGTSGFTTLTLLSTFSNPFTDVSVSTTAPGTFPIVVSSYENFTPAGPGPFTLTSHYTIAELSSGPTGNFYTLNGSFTSIGTPEPASLAAWGGMGLFGLVMAARRRKQK